MVPIIVSACLLGVKCKHDGTENFCPEVMEKVKTYPGVIPVCPEQLGGLPTPRVPAEISGGDGHDVWDKAARVYSRNGLEVTPSFIKGAEETLRIAGMFKAGGAVLKSGSPSCGCGWIRDGSFRGKHVEGDGVATALLKKHGIKVCHEEETRLIDSFFSQQR